METISTAADRIAESQARDDDPDVLRIEAVEGNPSEIYSEPGVLEAARHLLDGSGLISSDESMPERA